jgi:uncharacterized protein
VKEESVTIPSAGLNLSGVIAIPDGVGPHERRAAFLVLHGFGSNKESGNVLAPAMLLGEFGYVTLRFDMRGCGTSEGEHGFCLDAALPDLREIFCLPART